jgi:hypothetical protein
VTEGAQSDPGENHYSAEHTLCLDKYPARFIVKNGKKNAHMFIPRLSSYIIVLKCN